MGAARYWHILILPATWCQLLVGTGGRRAPAVSYRLSLRQSGVYHLIMTRDAIPPMTPERWLRNLLEALGAIADREHQERRWLALDARAWECPDELICTVDDVVFEGFLEQYASTFSEEQRQAASGFRDTFNEYCDSTPHHLDPAETLLDQRWDFVRHKAAVFVAAFTNTWPPADPVS
jgi:hypothetical protein